MASSSAHKIADNVHVIEPNSARWRTGDPNVVVVDDDPAEDTSKIEQIDTPDGGVTITIGNGEPEKKPRENLKFEDNLADDMNSDGLSAIAEHLLEGIDADLGSRKDWEDTANMAAKYLGIKLEDPASSVSADGTVCKQIATCMLEANIKLWGVARGELLPVGGPVKTRYDSTPNAASAKPGQAAPAANAPGAQQPQAQAQDQGGGIGNAPPFDKDALARALEADMNHFLTVIDREYYPDFSKMLFNRAMIGNAFRKVYYDPLKRRPTSVWVRAQDMIISNDCAHLSGAGRVTEQIKIRQSTMRRLQVAGHYRDIALVMPTGQTTETERATAEIEGINPTPQIPDDFEHLVYECYCELGSSARSSLIGDLAELDKDESGKRPGYPLPYRVSIDVDSREILEIRRNWKKGDDQHRPRQRYVKYGFVPGPGFWDLGLIHIVGNPTQAATMIQRASVDSALFANFPGGVYLKGVGSRQTDTVIRPNPGTFVGMEAGGATKIEDVIMGMPYKPPTPEVIGLGAKFESDARRLAGVIELPIGDGRSANIPVGTIMAYIESVSMVPGAVHKDDHITQQQEFELLRELFAEYPDTLTQGNRSPAKRWQEAAELLDPEIVPAADPNTPSEVHRIMKKQAMVSIGGMPQFGGIADNRKIYRDVMDFLSGGRGQDYEMAPQPQQAQPDPKVVSAEIRADSQDKSDASRLQIARENNQAKTAESAGEAIEGELDRQSEENRALLKARGEAVKTLHDSAGADADRTMDHSHHVDEMSQRKDELAQQSAGGIGAAAGGGPGFSSPGF